MRNKWKEREWGIKQISWHMHGTLKCRYSTTRHDYNVQGMVKGEHGHFFWWTEHGKALKAFSVFDALNAFIKKSLQAWHETQINKHCTTQYEVR